MKSWITNRHFIFVVRIAIGGVFIYAALDKIFHPDQFSRIIYNYHILPSHLVNAFSLFLPWVEFLSGLTLVTGFWHKSGSLLITGLLVVFVTALSVALIRGVNIECGCFTTTSHAKGPVINLIIRDIIMIIGCTLILAARKTFLALDHVRES